ncbi:hypothetical protein GCM10020000_16240 [Streptomyces olivoverticillatus]
MHQQLRTASGALSSCARTPPIIRPCHPSRTDAHHDRQSNGFRDHDPALVIRLLRLAPTYGCFGAEDCGSNYPLIDPALYRDRAFAGASLLTVLHHLAFNGTVFINSLQLQQVRGLSPMQA